METERNYRDRLYCMILTKDKKGLLCLYNTINKTHYTNPDDLEINTLENAIYMNMKNDISFVLDFSLNLYEQQSTFNPNMPLRNLFYLSKVLQGMVAGKNLYSTTLQKIPTPRFVVFYNGTEEQPEQVILRLSDAFQKPTDHPEIELIVTMLNINPGNNEELLEGCQTLKEYMLYVNKVRNYARTMPTRDAVNRAVNECILEGILADFLLRYKAEAIEVSIFEYDEAAHMSQIREEGREKGRLEGREEGRLEGREEGRTVGEWMKLISLIRKKLNKNIEAAQIAEMLEEDENLIKELISLIERNPKKCDEDLANLCLEKGMFL